MPHPGMRAMGEMRKQAAETKGSGRGGGIMSMVLPLYAVGIVVYMVYTLVKVSEIAVVLCSQKKHKVNVYIY